MMKMLICAGAVFGLAGCASVPAPDYFDVPVLKNADVIFLGRVLESKDAEFLFGDVVISGTELTYEVVRHPGTRVNATSFVKMCAQEQPDGGALLVFGERPSDGSRGPIHAYACQAVGRDFIDDLLAFEETDEGN